MVKGQLQLQSESKHSPIAQPHSRTNVNPQGSRHLTMYLNPNNKNGEILAFPQLAYSWVPFE